MFRAILVAYVLGGVTFVPLVLIGLACFIFYTSPPVGDEDPTERTKPKSSGASTPSISSADISKPRQAWVTARRTFEEEPTDASYINIMRSFLDSRSKDPKRARPKDAYLAVLKGNILFLYEDEAMSECYAAIDLTGYNVSIWPDGLLDGELFAKRNAIMLKHKENNTEKEMPVLMKDMKLQGGNEETKEKGEDDADKDKDVDKPKSKRESAKELEAKARQAAREEAFDLSKPWFIFVRPNSTMEDWYLAFIHVAQHPLGTPSLQTLQPVFEIPHMDRLVSTIDHQSDPIPMRWLNAFLGRVFFSVYKTAALEQWIVARLVRKLSKVKRPTFLTDIVVREVSVGTTAPTFSKPMLKELTKEGEASIGIDLLYKGEIRITVEATAAINLGARFKGYTVKLVLAVLIKEIEGNLLLRVKSPPSNRVWYAFTQMPRLELEVLPVVSDRQIKWSMILNTIESKMREIILESVVLPNMDDIPFFDTSPYDLRGGIFPEAARKETIDVPPVPNSLDDEVEPVHIKRTQTLDAMPPNTTAEGATAPNSASVPQSETSTSLPATLRANNDVNVTPKKSSAWFSGRKTTPQKGEDTMPGGLLEVPEDRGRNAVREIDLTDSSIKSERGKSAPASDRSSSSDSVSTPTQAAENPIEITVDRAQSASAPILETAPPRPRSSSHHSSSKSITNFLSAPSSPSPPSMLSAGPPSSPSPSSSTTSSFLNTLKARAGDKQALSASAREAMSKWSAGWSKLRSRQGQSSEGDDQGDDSGKDMFEGEPRSAMGKSFADLRAKVESRKEKEPEHQQRDEPSRPRSLYYSTSSQPIDIPQSEARARTHSSVTPERRNSVGFSGGIVPSVSPGTKSSSSSVRKQSISSATPLFVAPSAPKTTIELQTGVPSELVLPSTTLEPPTPTTPQPLSPPIHVQPSSAAMMIIPGIHAKHRNDVMALGYTPDPPPEEVPKAIVPSVYRIFKKRSNPSIASTSSQSTRSDNSTAALTPPAPPPLPPRSPPPPLPPRSNSIVTQPAVSSPEPQHATPIPAPEPEPEAPAVPAATTPVVVAESPASEALKQVVVQDEASRSSQESSGSSAPSRKPSQESNVPSDLRNGEVPELEAVMEPKPIFAEEPMIRTDEKPPLPPRRNSHQPVHA